MQLPPGKFLKQLREKLCLGLRQVQQASRRIADAEGSTDFYISAARLTQIENGNSMPSIFKLFSLSAIYGVDIGELLRRFGVDLDRAKSYQGLVRADVTQPLPMEVYNPRATVTLPVRLSPGFRWESTQLMSRVVELWGEVPVALLLKLNPRRHLYGYVGMRDFSMYPLVRPGSLVMIDQRRCRVDKPSRQSEFERPIYFVELHNGYRCCWCQLEGACLTLIPHPMSGVATQSFNFPDEAEIVGQVVGLAMRILPPEGPNPASTPRLSTLSSSEK